MSETHRSNLVRGITRPKQEPVLPGSRASKLPQDCFTRSPDRDKARRMNFWGKYLPRNVMPVVSREVGALETVAGSG
jgi:hypothetical protein